MDFSAATWWWVAAGIAVAAELATGTFHLLMLALGLVAGAVAAHLGAGVAAQIVAASLVAAAFTAVWHWRRSRHPASLPANRNRDVNLDIGERVRVEGWGTDGTTRVQYRGTQWSARLQPGAVATASDYRVAAIEGNWLVLAPPSTAD